MPASPDRETSGPAGPRRAGRGGAGRGRRATSEGGGVETLERVPPQNLEAESATLGSMLLDGEAAGLAAERLVPDDFYRTANRHIFQTACEIYDAGQQPDELVLRERLLSKGLLEETGGSEYIHSLASSVPSAANLDRYVRIVKEKAILRKLISATTTILREADDSTEVEDLLDRAEQRIFDVASQRGYTDVVEIKDILKEELEDIERRMKSPGLITGLPTGFTELDQMTGGLQRSDLVILAARPSVGKTSLALNWVEYLGCNEDQPALVFSLEMSRSQVAKRLLCSHCEVAYHKLRSGDLENDFQKIVDKGMAPLSEAPILIDDTAAISAMELRAKARRMKSRHDIKLVVVDYLQLMRGPSSRTDNREREVARISSALKALGRELRIPVLALSQLRRGAEERRGGKPQLADLRESGALEQDADVVMLLHRDREEEGALSNDAVLNVAKQRNGPTGVVRLRYRPQYMRFAESDVGPE
ncbi:MAG: replicative DNA helicase [Planctomycetota bacterium]|jgi:replicative DNA helicase